MRTGLDPNDTVGARPAVEKKLANLRFDRFEKFGFL